MSDSMACVRISVTGCEIMNPDTFCLLIAIWEILVGISLLFYHQKFLQWVDRVSNDKAKVRVFLLGWVVIGVLALSRNMQPAWDLPGVMSLLAWLTTVKCGLMMISPYGLISFSLSLIKKTTRWVGVFVLAIGGLLIYSFLALQS